MHEKFFTSDYHLWHANIIRFLDDDGLKIRPFFSLEEMHERIIEEHNKLVKPNDYVYNLGDVTFRYDGAFNSIMSRLHGRKRLLLGNHDKILNPGLRQHFEKVELWKGFKEGNFTGSHMPLKEGSFRDGDFNVHGHTHQRPVRLPNGLIDPHYICVCLEQRGWKPVHYDEILQEIKTRGG